MYTEKKHAKQAGRAFHPGEHLNVYRCGSNWHYGHLHEDIVREDIVRGDITRGELYGNGEA